MSPLRHQSALQRGHEHSDVPVRPVALFTGGLALFIAASLGLMALLLAWFERGAPPAPPEPDALAETRPIFPEPRLQTDPLGDLQRLRAREEELLRRYGWVDRERGIVRIPVAAAMDRIAAEGLPEWPSAQEEPR